MIGDVLQPTHLIFILVIALLVLGPKRLPEVGKSLGRGIRDFKGALSGIDDQLSAEPTQQAPTSQVAPVTPATTAVPEEAPAVVPVPSGVVPAADVIADAVEVHDEGDAAATGGGQESSSAPEALEVAPAVAEQQVVSAAEPSAGQG